MRSILLLLALGLSCFFFSGAQVSSDNKARGEHHDVPALDDATIASGLKAALEISTTKAIAIAGKRDGFLENESIRILLPPELQAIGKSMRLLEMGDQVDDLEIGMNRAAEQATPQAKPIFLAALKKMSFNDPRLVLNGSDTAASDYFRRTSSADLSAAFTPIVHHSLERAGVIKQYQRVIKNDPGGSALASKFDLDKYVVEKTLDAIFYMLAAEETNIRRDPTAQTSPLLKDVFGSK
jgi:hypothetical protein